MGLDSSRSPRVVLSALPPSTNEWHGSAPTLLSEATQTRPPCWPSHAPPGRPSKSPNSNSSEPSVPASRPVDQPRAEPAADGLISAAASAANGRSIPHRHSAVAAVRRNPTARPSESGHRRSPTAITNRSRSRSLCPPDAARCACSGREHHHQPAGVSEPSRRRACIKRFTITCRLLPRRQHLPQ